MSLITRISDAFVAVGQDVSALYRRVLGIESQLSLTLEQFDVDYNNAHIAAQEAFDVISAAGSGTLKLLDREYIFRAPTYCTAQNIKIEGTPGTRVVVTNDIPDEIAAIELSSQSYLEPTGSARQAVIGSLAYGARSCVVADASQFQRGDVAGIVSGLTVNNGQGEYWFGIPGQAGFGAARKCEMVEIERVDLAQNRVWFMAPLLDSYNAVDFAVQLRKFQMKGQVVIDGVNFHGPGGGGSHSGTGPVTSTGPRALNIWGFRDVTYRGGVVRNFGRIATMFYNCLAGTLNGVDADGWAAEDASNFKPDDPLFRSVWFTAFYICGGMNWNVHGNNARNMRRLADIDRGPWFPRNVVYTGNTADNCEYVLSGHVGDRIEYIGNIGIRCRFGIMTRARYAKVHGNQIQCERYGLQAGPISGSGIIWDANTANAGSLEFTDNMVEVTDGEYFATLLSFDRLILKGNTFWGSRYVGTGSDIRHSVNIQAKVMRNLLICDNLIDMSQTSGSLGDCIFIGDGDQGSGGVLEVQDGVSIFGNELRGGSTGIRYRGVSLSQGSTLGSRSKNIQLGPNKHVNHVLRDVRFEQGAYDGSRIRVLMGQSFGERTAWPRVSLGNDMKRWSELPLIDQCPQETTDGRFVGQIAPPLEANGNQISGATHRQGQFYRNSNPVTGQPFLFVVTQDGTRGSLGSVTGSITSGQSTLTVSSAANLFTGAFITVAGANFTDGVARVTGVSGNVVTLDRNAGATVSNATVAYRNSAVSSASVI